MFSFSALAFCALASSAILPKSAVIVDAHDKLGDNSVGNVKVLFTDGHSELWTKLGKSLLPRVSATGLVGWAHALFINARGWPVDSVLRVCWPDGHHKDFKADSAFIEIWNFVENDTAVVIKSRGAHGPAAYIKYDLRSGKDLAHADAFSGTPLPGWAKPYSD
jgi:hypothetical protein